MFYDVERATTIPFYVAHCSHPYNAWSGQFSLSQVSRENSGLWKRICTCGYFVSNFCTPRHQGIFGGILHPQVEAEINRGGPTRPLELASQKRATPVQNSIEPLPRRVTSLAVACEFFTNRKLPIQAELEQVLLPCPVCVSQPTNRIGLPCPVLAAHPENEIGLVCTSLSTNVFCCPGCPTCEWNSLCSGRPACESTRPYQGCPTYEWILSCTRTE